MWRIRKSFESASLRWEDFLTITDLSVTFNRPSDYWLDAEVFLNPIEGKPLEEKIENIRLFSGELLPGFYDEWVLLERDRFQAAYHRKMGLLLDALIDASQWTEAVRWSEEWIRLGYAPEPAFRGLMQAYGAMGDRSMARASYQRCVDALERDLGVEPSLETKQLYEDICLGDFGSKAEAQSVSTDAEPCVPDFLAEEIQVDLDMSVFVSRERELARLDGFLEEALNGCARNAFVIGEAGSGKTSLMNAFIRRGLDAYPDLIVASGNCNAQTGIGDPYLPFRELLELLTGDIYARWSAGAITRGHARALWNTLPVAVSALVDEGPDLIGTFLNGASLVERAETCVPKGATWLAILKERVADKRQDPTISSTMQTYLFEQYTRVIKAIARKVPLVLVLDDLQWADQGSISLLFHLSRHLAGSRILILGAYRSEEIAIGRGGERHPLAPVVSELQRVYGDLIVDVDQAERRDFLEALLDSEPNRLGVPFRDMLFRQTQGHPLFTIELLRGLQERGDLVHNPQGEWVEGPSLDWGRLPARVEAVITERIDRLPQALQKALRAASVEGEVFTAEVLAQIQGQGAGEVLSLLSDELDRKHQLVQAHSIQRVDGQLLSGYRFRHIQIQKYLYNSLNQVEQVHLHEQVGLILENLYGAQEMAAEAGDLSSTVTPVVRLARHFQEAGITNKAIHYLHLAGERAVQLSAYQEARAHLERGLALLLTLPESKDRDRQELKLQLALGRAMKGAVGMGLPIVDKTFGRARDLCQQIGDTRQLWQVVGELAIIHFVRVEYQQARKLAEENFRLAQDMEDPIYLILSHWMLGFILFGLGEIITAREHMAKVIDFYQPKHHQEFLKLRGTDAGLSALSYDVCFLWLLGYPEQAQKQSREAIAAAEKFSHPFTSAEVLNFSGCLYNELRRDLIKLIDNAERLIETARFVGLAWSGAGFRYRGEALALLGQVEEGRAQMQKGLGDDEISAARCFITSILGNLAYASAKAGEIDYGVEILEQVFARVEKSDERYAEAELNRIKGEISLMQGKEDEAEASYLQAIDIAQKQQAKSWELRATTSLARLWQRQGKMQEAKQALSDVYDWFTEGFETLDLREAHALLKDLS